MTNWTSRTNPFGSNHTPLLQGLSSVDGATPVPVAVDPATGALITEAGSADTTIAPGTAPASAIVAGQVYNSIIPTPTTGQTLALQSDPSGNLLESLGTLIAGEDLISNRTVVEQRYTYWHMSTGTTSTIKSTAAFLHSITINTPVASATITVYDSTAGSGQVIAIITLGGTLANDCGTFYLYDVVCLNGLTVVTSGATDITISYR